MSAPKLPLDLGNPYHREIIATEALELVKYGPSKHHPCDMCSRAHKDAYLLVTTPEMAAEVVRVECERLGLDCLHVYALPMSIIAEVIVGLMYASKREEAVDLIESARDHMRPFKR